MQQTTFKVEILIQDDASADKTAAIVREYEKKFPQLIKTTCQTENQFFKKPKTSEYIKPPARKGKYIALCEGDDYWTDPLKLQKQVSFLEANPDFAICHHNMQVVYVEITKESHLSNSAGQKEVTTIADLAEGNYIFTASAISRYGLFGDYPEWLSKCQVGDYPTHMLNAQFGKIKYISDVMGVYRVHKEGYWEHKDEIYRRSIWIDLIDQMKDQFTPEINKILRKAQNTHAEYMMLNMIDQPERCKFFTAKLLENNPLYVANLKQAYTAIQGIADQKKEEIIQLNTQLFQSKDELYQKDSAIKQAGEDLKILRDEFVMLKNSMAYKLGSFLLRFGFIAYPIELMFKKKRKTSASNIAGAIRKSGLFNEEFYLRHNVDVQQHGMNAMEHFICFGGFEGRNPSPEFSSSFYLNEYPDVKRSGMNPLVHYVLYGKREGRNPLPNE